ncbi:glycosyltransferase family 2 protein [Microbacterium aurantiacum]|uniref:glycosyltransferase family 2 protein n=1 Tax=Microbacterium aurantiacum TaxID=162393 RepID=UPI003D760586
MTGGGPVASGIVPGNRWDLVGDARPATPPRVSVIVAHYDQPDELARTLAALAAQDHPADRLEIIVADDGSPHPVSVPAGVRVVRQEDRGFRLAAVRNLGVRASTGDILCFLDADTAPEPGYISALTRLPALLPDTVTVGRRRHADLAGVPVQTPVAEAVRGRELAEPAWLADAYARSRNLLDADDRSYRYVIGAVIACSRRLFDDVGGFDESFTAYGGEDWEWAHRAWQAGALLAHVPDAVAWHDGPEWAGREGSDRERANAQTLRLAASVPVSGSAGFGVRRSMPDLAVYLTGEHSDAALFVCVDSILAAFPHAVVVLDAEPAVEALRADARVRVRGGGRASGGGGVDARVTWTLERPMLIDDASGLAECLAALGSGEVGTIEVESGGGVVRSRRADRRAARSGTEDGFVSVRRRVPGIHPLRPDPHVEAYVGGWGSLDAFV